jgi:N-acetylglucosaminyldiphosphoundecaprenol N-acetyl-beta-D-mannosaminyltransferase
MQPDRRLLFGLYIDALAMDGAIGRCKLALATRDSIQIGVLNAAKIVALRRDPMLREAVLSCDVVLADGQSVVWASRLLGRALPERVAGIDLFERLLELAHAEARSVYLLGATPSVLEALKTRLWERFPGLNIAGARDGYFGREEWDNVADDIRRSGADMLFLGMSSPKKETFLAAVGPTLGVPILHGVGGSFDVLAGVTRRAPAAWQRAGMEWAFRVLQEPRRLWRRYMTSNLAFLALVAHEFMRPDMPFSTGSGDAPLRAIQRH